MKGNKKGSFRYISTRKARENIGPLLLRGVKKKETDFSVAPSRRRSGNGYKPKNRKFHLNVRHIHSFILL